MADQTTEFALSRGFLGVSSILTTRRRYDLSDEMIFRDRAIAKFWNVLSRKLTKMKVTSYEPKMWDFVPESNVFPIKNNAGTGTSFHIEDTYAQQLQAGDILTITPTTVDANIQSNIEATHVQTVGAAGSAATGQTLVTVIRNNGAGGTGSVNIATAANFKLIWNGNANQDGGGSGFPINKEPGLIQNYIQQFTKDVGETRAEKNETSVYARMSLAKKAQMKRELLMEEIDWALLIGTLGKSYVDGAAKRTTRGITGYIDSTNVVSMAAKMSAPAFIEQMETYMFAEGNKRREKWLFCGGGFKTKLNAIPWSEAIYQTNPDYSKIVGFKVDTIDAGPGILHVVNMDNWRGTGFYNAGIVVDLDYVAYMYVEDLSLIKDTAPKNVSWNRTQWTMYGDIGLFAAWPKAHLILHSPSAP